MKIFQNKPKKKRADELREKLDEAKKQRCIAQEALLSALLEQVVKGSQE